MVEVTIERCHNLDGALLASLISASEAEHWKFVRKLADEWNSGTNLISQPGEALFAAFSQASDDERLLVGICGLNVDPYAADLTCGRGRRMYVLPAYRRQGIATQLLTVVINHARSSFLSLRLRTENPHAAAFYERFGFVRCSEDASSHVLRLV